VSDLARLKALADGATKGNWRVGSNRGDGVTNIVESEWDYVCECYGYGASEPANAAYIAALSPDVAKALIARVERAEAALRETCAALDSVLKSDGLLDAEEIALDHGLAALAALEAS